MVGHCDHVRRGERSYTYRRYVCHANVRVGPGTCRRNSARQERLVREVAALVRENLTSPQRIAVLRAELEALAREEAAGVSVEREQLVARIAELDANIDRPADAAGEGADDRPGRRAARRLGRAGAEDHAALRARRAAEGAGRSAPDHPDAFRRGLPARGGELVGYWKKYPIGNITFEEITAGKRR
jgi:hypothetical protein